MRRLVSPLVLAAALAGCSEGAEPGPEAGWRLGEGAPLEAVPPARLARLSRGVNLGGWFAQATVTPEHLATFVTGDDARRIRAMGFRHVRLPFDPDGVLVGSRITEAGADRLGALEAALDLFLAEGLAVVVDLHPGDTFKADLRRYVGSVEQTAALWNALAYRLRHRDPERVFFEVLNEPGFEDAARWAEVQSTLVRAVRAAAPEHTVLATSARWSDPGEFAALQPVDDPNVVYAVHLYAPHAFTHQGATWGWEPWARLHGLPYPSSPGAVAPVLPTLDPGVRGVAESYGEERWGPERLRAEVEPAVAWAARHGVPLVCTEFGVYRPAAPADARTAWLRDARGVLEAAGVGWSVWEYAGGFGVTSGPPGARAPDPEVARALGLSP